ncbi:MAG: acyltransferase family protein [Chloroflexota bacterium]|nr:acyltransferase family protein [Chloroflexota bacterium]
MLLVYCSHLYYRPSLYIDRRIPGMVQTFLFSGFNGVSIFFVLSGFVICYNYYDRMTENPRAHLWEYFVARFARLYPIYLLTFLWFFSSGNIQNQLHTSRAIILSNLTMTQAWSANQSVYWGYNPVSWSLSIEAFFYLIFPFLAVALLKRLSRIWQFIAVGIIVSSALLAAAMWFSATSVPDFYGSPHYWLYQLPATRVGDFVLGCLAARIYVLRSSIPVTKREAKIGGGALLVCILAIGVIMCINVPALIPFRFGPAYAPFIVVAIYCLARYNTLSSRVLSTKPLILLGAASYSFYLIHAIVIDAVAVPASAIGAKSAYLHDVLIFAAVTILSLGAYTYVEMPARKFLRRTLTRQRSPVLQPSIAGIPGEPGIMNGWEPERQARMGTVIDVIPDEKPVLMVEPVQTSDHPDGKRAPLSLRQRHVAAIVILGFISCIFFGSLFKGETYSDVASQQNNLYPWAATPHPRSKVVQWDQADTYFPWQVFISHAFHRHEFPLWNPDSFLGQPFFANGQNSLLYPPRILLAVLVPPNRVHDLLLLSHMLLGGVAMYFLLARQRLAFAAALFGAVAWMLNSFMLVWMALETYLVIEAWLPVAFLLVAAVVYRRSWPAAVGLGVVMALMFWGGSTLFVEVTAITIGAYAAYLLLRPVWASRRRHGLTAAAARIARKCLPFGASAILFLGLIAVQALPTVELTATTTRVAYSLEQLTAPGGMHVVLADLGSFFLPRRYPMTEIYHHLLFLGTPTALLALIGLFRRRPLARYARWLAIIVLLLGLGTPLAAIPYHLVPGFSNMFLGRLMFLFAFGVAILSAFGLDLVIRRGARVPRWLYRSIPFVGSAITWSSRFIRSRVPRRTFAGVVSALLIGIVVLQMYDLSSDVNRHQPSDPAYLYPKTPIIQQLAQQGDVRIMPIIPFFYASDAMMFDMQRIGGYDSLVPARTINLETVVGSGDTVQQVYNQPVDGPFTEIFQVPHVQVRYAQRLGITDILTAPTIDPNPWWTASVQLAHLDLAYAGPDGYDYTVRDTMPESYLVGQCEQADSPFNALQRFTDLTAFDPTQSVIVEAGSRPVNAPPCAPVAGAPSYEAVGRARITHRDLNTLTLDVNASRDSWLVVLDSWDAGWKATVDGKPVQVLPGNYAFRTLPVTAGRHTVQMQYLPRSFVVGRDITEATLSVTGIAIVVSVVASIRRRRGQKRRVRAAEMAGEETR